MEGQRGCINIEHHQNRSCGDIKCRFKQFTSFSSVIFMVIEIYKISNESDDAKWTNNSTTTCHTPRFLLGFRKRFFESSGTS